MISLCYNLVVIVLFLKKDILRMIPTKMLMMFEDDKTLLTACGEDSFQKKKIYL